MARTLIALAGIPDDASDLDRRLTEIAQLTTESVPAVSYASVTTQRENAYTTVAATSALAAAVDEAQYADGDGPCLNALETGVPVAVPEIGATMRWPGFRESAARMGLHASLSVPLFAGSGVSVAAMNLYGHDRFAMAALTARIRAVYRADAEGLLDFARVAPGPHVDSLTAGLIGAFGVRGRIQLAIGTIMERQQCSSEDAYVSLRIRAAETGTPLPEAAAAALRRMS